VGPLRPVRVRLSYQSKHRPQGTAGEREKGVLLLTFEYNWLRVLANPKVARYLDEVFHAIFQTSWSPADWPSP
jgi:hypothetical protein